MLLIELHQEALQMQLTCEGLAEEKLVKVEETLHYLFA